MNEPLFRSKSMERIKSPEQLDDYIRVTNPGVWMLLASIIILLTGVCVWGVTGHLDTTLSTVGIVKNSTMTVYVKEVDAASVEDGMIVRIDDNEWKITEISDEPMTVGTDFSEYALHVGGLKNGEWVYAASVSGKFSDGVYDAEIIIDSVSPMSFVLN